MEHRPEIGCSYGTLAQVVIINRLSFEPQPLYALKAWAKLHGLDRFLGIDAAWLDDDRLEPGIYKDVRSIWLFQAVFTLHS